MKFVHLHTHSHFSLLEASGKVDEILDRAKELGMDTIAVTEYANLYSAVEFTTMAKERDMKVIIGCELFVSPREASDTSTAPENKVTYNITLLATNEIGYKNLMKLVTKAHLDGNLFGKPRVDKNLLKAHHEGLIALSGCLEGEIPQWLIKDDMAKARRAAEEYRDIFGAENFYFELQSHPRVPEQERVNKGLKLLSKELSIPPVATADIHYVRPEDAEIQDIMLCIKDNRKEYENDRRTMTDYDLYIKSPEEMAEAFQDVPEAIENTEKIAKRCDFKITLGDIQLPHYPLPKGETPSSALRTMTEKRLKERYGDAVTKEQRDRMEYELDIIDKMGYPDYFLIVQDFVNWARSSGIVVGPGRGSAAGSFVSYLVGITNIDPIKYDLLFERFLNPERVSMPDVDMDFADDRRDDVLEYCRQKYGWDHVAHIITFGTMAARAAIRDVGRALGLAYGFCDQVAKLIPMFASIEKALEEVPEFRDLYEKNQDARRLIDTAKKLEGSCRHASIHACGVVITKDPVVEYTPLQRVSGDDRGVCTQYSSSTKTSYVEKIGLLKMDFLGLKNLTIIQDTLLIIKKIHSIDIDIEKLPLDDEETYKLLQRGETTGVFQLESSGMKRYLKLLKPTVFEDIIAMVALYRPGPMEWIPDFIGGKHGTKKVKYLHPKLESILKNTYGVAVYQEQVMQIAQALAGFSLGEADILRKAMGKKILDLIKEQRQKFIEGCEKTGVGKKIGEKVFAFIEPFAGYGFNRSHAACYALIGYQTAYLKAHYPAEFMAALLTSDQDNSDRVAIEVSEARDMGITVLPPNVNESYESFAALPKNTEHSSKNNGKPPILDAVQGAIEERSQVVHANTAASTGDRNVAMRKNREFSIRFGLNAIKNVGKPVAKEIVKERKKDGKYTSLANFIERIQIKDLNKRSLESLAKVGAFDDFAERNEVLENIDTILGFIKSLNAEKNSSQSSLFDGSAIAAPTMHLKDAAAASKRQRLEWEKELLGLYVSDHPTREYETYLDRTTHRLDQLTPEMIDQVITIGGIIQYGKKIYLKDQKQMYFAMVENTRGKIECVVFPRTYEQTSELWQNDTFVIVTGKLSDKDGEFKLLAETVKALTPEEVENLKRLEATRRKYATSSSSLSSRNPERVRESKDIRDPDPLRHREQSPESVRAFSGTLRSDPGNSKSWIATSKTPRNDTETLKNPSTESTVKESFTIKIPAETAKEKLQQLSDYLKSLPAGGTPVHLDLQGKEVKTSYCVNVNDTIRSRVREILGS